MTKWSDWIFANYRSLLRIIHTNLSLNTTHHHINTVCMFLFSSWPDHIIRTVCNWSKRELLHINFIPFHWFVFHMQYPFEYFQQHSSINTLGRNTSSHKYHLVPSTTPACPFPLLLQLGAMQRSMCIENYQSNRMWMQILSPNDPFPSQRSSIHRFSY